MKNRHTCKNEEPFEERPTINDTRAHIEAIIKNVLRDESTFHGTKMHYMVTYWKRVYDRIHPKFTQPGTNGRRIFLEVLKKCLTWHLETTTNGDERTKIKHA